MDICIESTFKRRIETHATRKTSAHTHRLALQMRNQTLHARKIGFPTICVRAYEHRRVCVYMWIRMDVQTRYTRVRKRKLGARHTSTNVHNRTNPHTHTRAHAYARVANLSYQCTNSRKHEGTQTGAETRTDTSTSPVAPARPKKAPALRTRVTALATARHRRATVRAVNRPYGSQLCSAWAIRRLLPVAAPPSCHRGHDGLDLAPVSLRSQRAPDSRSQRPGRRHWRRQRW